MKQRIKEHVEYISFKSDLIKKVHQGLARKYRIIYVTIKSATVILSLLIATLTLTSKNYLTHEMLITSATISILLSLSAIFLFIISVLSVILKLDKKIYIHEQAINKYEKLLKELIYKKYEIKDQNMSSYKSFMYEITSKYNKIMENLPSEYFLRVNSIFCKKYQKYHKPEELIKFPNDNGNLPSFMPGYNV